MQLAMVGDVMLGRGVAGEIGYRSPEGFWGNTLPLLREAGLALANLECAITTHATPWTHPPKVYHFRTPPEGIDILLAAGVRLVSLANNHTLDFGEAGLLDTLRALDAAGIAYAGAGIDLTAARRPAVVAADGLQIGMIAFSDNIPEWAATPDTAGISHIDIRPDPETFSIVEQGVERARAAGAQLVILSLHWGPNMRLRPPEHFRQFVHGALNRGVDLVYGHSAHVFQGVEIYKGKPILYDTGDFLDDYATDPLLRNDQSLIFFAEIEGTAVQALRMVPVHLKYSEVDLAVNPELDEICSRIIALSREMNTHVVRHGDTLHVDVRPT
ncbi:MAG TPA: CapA family protein [Chthonomonadaceae bacterium]|nr:CapA family protein [Chthonomonadaceae bacterium]